MLSARGPRLRKSGRCIALCAVLLVATPGFGQSVGSREQLLRPEERIRRQQDQIEELQAALAEQADLVKALQERLPSTVEQPATEAGGAPLVTKSPTTVGTEKFNLRASGFMEATAMVRSRNQNADVGETFGNVPLDGTANSFLSSFRMSSRHSRLSLLASARFDRVTATGYFEGDFPDPRPPPTKSRATTFRSRCASSGAMPSSPTASRSWQARHGRF